MKYKSSLTAEHSWEHSLDLGFFLNCYFNVGDPDLNINNFAPLTLTSTIAFVE